MKYIPEQAEALGHYENVKKSVESSGKGQDPLTIGHLAQSIVVGTSGWASDGRGHVALLLELAQEIATLTGEPVEVYNRATEHEHK